LREATLGGISPIRLRWLHQRAAEALEAEDSDETYTRIADHFERAGKPAKASEYFARAAGHSGQLFAFDEALEYYRRAIVLENRTAKVADLYEGRGDILKLLGVRDDAFHAFEQALNLTEVSLQKARLARKQIDLISRFDHNLAQEKYASASLEIAHAVDEPGYWHEWIEIQFVWLQACYWRQDLESQETMLAQIREPVRESGTPVQQVRYWHHFINCQFVRERYFLNESHVALARENLERAAALDDSHMISTARQQYGMVVLAAEQFELSEAMFREAIALSEKNGNYQSLLIARTYISVVHRRMKRPEDVRADISELDRVLKKSNKNPQYVAVADANRAWLAYHDGKLDEARRLAQAALDTWGTQASKFPACWLAAFILLALGVDDGDVDEIIARSRFMLTPYYQRLRLNVEAALHAMLEVDPANHDLVIRLGRETVEKAKEAGYL
jgi:tetratricopeptide (TPR) repeat protein